MGVDSAQCLIVLIGGKMTIFIGIRFTKEQFSDIFHFSVDNASEDQFQEIEDEFLLEVDYDGKYVYIGEEIHDEESCYNIQRVNGYIQSCSDDTRLSSGKEGLHIFKSSWR